METFGVPVIGFETKEFPAFYNRHSGLSVDYKMDDPALIAQTLKVKWDLGLNGGVVIANPIPEKFQMAYADINVAIEQALKTADSLQIKGKEITPFLLAKVEELTEGKSLAANIELVLNNARLAAQVAKAFAVL